MRNLTEVLEFEDGSTAGVLTLMAVAAVSLVAVTASLAVCLCSDPPADPPPKPTGPGVGYQPSKPPPGARPPQYPPQQDPRLGSHGQYPPYSQHGDPRYQAGYYDPPRHGPPHPRNPQAMYDRHGNLIVDPRQYAGYPPQGDPRYAAGDPHQAPPRVQNTYPEYNPPGAGGDPRLQGYDPRRGGGPQDSHHGPQPGAGYGKNPRMNIPLPHGRQGSHAGDMHALDSPSSVASRPESRRPDSAMQGRPGGGAASQTDLRAQDNSVQALENLLHQVCDRMNGSIYRSAKLQKASIRAGTHAVMGDVQTTYGSETVVFFPDEARYAKQRRQAAKAGFKDFMPIVSEERPAGVHREGNMTVWLPSHITYERCTSVVGFLKENLSSRERMHELFNVVEQLTGQLQQMHRREVVLRDLGLRNVVRARITSGQSWTLLEYASSAKVNMQSSSIPAESTPPELAEARWNEQPVVLKPSYDMWQLGVLLYEVAMKKRYWPEELKSNDILHTLASPRAPLPHQEMPVPEELVQRIVSKLLTRKAEERLTADMLKNLLAKEQETGTMNATINAGHAMTELPIQLPT